MVILYIIILISIAALLLMPIERIVIKRIILARKIERICKKNDINFKVINRFYAVSKNSNDKFDFLMRIGNTVYPIKLYSAKDPNSILVVNSNHDATVRQKLREPLSRDGSKKNKVLENHVKIPTMKIKSYMIGKKFACVPIFLNEPAYSAVLISDGKGGFDSNSRNSMRIGGCHWLDKYEFAYMVKNQIR